jgi:hypothetical protein
MLVVSFYLHKGDIGVDSDRFSVRFSIRILLRQSKKHIAPLRHSANTGASASREALPFMSRVDINPTSVPFVVPLGSTRRGAILWSQ